MLENLLNFGSQQRESVAFLLGIVPFLTQLRVSCHGSSRRSGQASKIRGLSLRQNGAPWI